MPPCQSIRACERDTRVSSMQKVACGLRPSTTGRLVPRRCGSGRARPGGCPRARTSRLSMSPNAVAAVSRSAARPPAGARAPARRGRAAASSPGCGSASAPTRRGRSTTLAVTSVSLSPAWSSRRAATLTASPKQSPAISTTSPRASADLQLERHRGARRLVRAVGRARGRAGRTRCAARRACRPPPGSPSAGVVEHRHQAVAERLDDLAAVRRRRCGRAGRRCA